MNEEDQLKRWAEHYQSVMNHPSAISAPELHAHALSAVVDTV